MELGPPDFNGQKLRQGGTLAVVFLASWCPFCLRFQPAFEAAAKSSGTPWAWVDVSEDDSIFWDTFSLSVVPTVVVFRDGEPVFRRDGKRFRGLSQDVIRETIDYVKASTEN
jgi:thioredoxin 1